MANAVQLYIRYTNRREAVKKRIRVLKCENTGATTFSLDDDYAYPYVLYAIVYVIDGKLHSKNLSMLCDEVHISPMTLLNLLDKSYYHDDNIYAHYDTFEEAKSNIGKLYDYILHNKLDVYV